MSDLRPFVGTWRLLSYRARDSRGSDGFPFGRQASGQLIYDEGGHMSAHVLKRGRPIFAAEDPARGTDPEVRSAFEGHVSYFGTYTVDAAVRKITHHVDGASFPNWIGRDLVRYFSFDGDLLVLSTPPLPFGGDTFEYVLTWERVHPTRQA